MVHPGYKNDEGRALLYDFALLRLDRKVRFSKDISPACLPPPGLSLDKGFVVGWGNEKVINRQSTFPGLLKGQGYKLSSVLQELEVNGMSISECERIYNQLGINLDSSNLCAGSDEGDTCTGDSGGGVFVNQQGSAHVSVWT